MAFDILSYVLAKKHTKETTDGLGSIQGANCTIKTTTPTSIGTDVTFEWTGTSGAKQTTTISVKNGESAYKIACDNGFVGTEQDWLDSLKIDDSDIETIVQDKLDEQLQDAIDDTIANTVNYATDQDIDDLWA